MQSRPWRVSVSLLVWSLLVWSVDRSLLVWFGLDSLLVWSGLVYSLWSYWSGLFLFGTCKNRF